MTDRDLQAIAARNEKRKLLRAFAGPSCWTAADWENSYDLDDKTATFIAHAYNDPVSADVEALVDELQRLRAAVDGVLGIDIEYQWGVLSKEAAGAFLKLGQVREGFSAVPGVRDE